MFDRCWVVMVDDPMSESLFALWRAIVDYSEGALDWQGMRERL